MRLTRLNNTCSMYELGDLTESKILSSSFKEDLKSLIKSVLPIRYKNKVIIYNTNYNWFWETRARLKLFIMGFRQIASYKGVEKTYVLMKKLKS